MDASVKGAGLKVVDLDVIDFSTQGFDDTGEQVVGEGTGHGVALEAAVDGHSLGAADDDGELALAIDFFEPDELLVLHLADDDFVQFHLDGHVRAPFLLTPTPSHNYVRCTMRGCQ